MERSTQRRWLVNQLMVPLLVSSGANCLGMACRHHVVDLWFAFDLEIYFKLLHFINLHNKFLDVIRFAMKIELYNFTDVPFRKFRNGY